MGTPCTSPVTTSPSSRTTRRSPSTSPPSLRRTKQAHFITIAFKAEHLKPADRPLPGRAFEPQILVINNDWEDATIPTTIPAGTPPVAKLDETFNYGKVLTDASHVLPQNEQCAALRDEWRAFTAARLSTNERAADFVPQWVFVPVPRLAPVRTAQRIADD